jgi:hypothetical protein
MERSNNTDEVESSSSEGDDAISAIIHLDRVRTRTEGYYYYYEEGLSI